MRYQEDDPLPPVIVKYAPDPECPMCEGSASVLEDGKRVECICILKQRMRDYLTPRYVDHGPVEKKFKMIEYTSNRLFEGVTDDNFEHMVHSFLRRGHMKYSFKSETGADIITRWLDNSGDNKKDIRALHGIDFLIVELMGDTPNKEYTSVLQTLFERRTREDHFTWVRTRYSVASTAFRDVYGNGLSNYLQTPAFRKATFTS